MKSLALGVAIAWLSVAQSGGPAIAGVWTAELAGRTFVRLELKNSNGTMTGGISIGDIEVDSQGVVSRAGELPKTPTPIADVALRGSMLSFSRKDGNEIDTFELHLLNDGASELHFVLSESDRRELAASGVPVPKPIRLTRR